MGSLNGEFNGLAIAVLSTFCQEGSNPSTTYLNIPYRSGR
ncbi:hypothetical protein D082_08560 [Synechocystis sp. PCC 6714]|nr:hypothetical protein D082_08560 [Synechocystis sp. PCC 6714]